MYIHVAWVQLPDWGFKCNKRCFSNNTRSFIWDFEGHDFVELADQRGTLSIQDLDKQTTYCSSPGVCLEAQWVENQTGVTVSILWSGWGGYPCASAVTGMALIKEYPKALHSGSRPLSLPLDRVTHTRTLRSSSTLNLTIPRTSRTSHTF